MYSHLYSEFLKQTKGEFYFTAHSHHFWPDITFEAQKNYWMDSAKLVDKKWDKVFSEVIPEAQKLIGEIINFDRPSDITFAPNTHELGFRLLSCLDLNKKQKILTTTCEFHSFSRQIKRLEELENIQVVYCDPSDLVDIVTKDSFDFIFFSQVFFNTGEVLDLSTIEKIVNNSANAIVCIDGYHGFGAIPTDISSISDRAFYLSGSYKYAQGGEGACFMTLPLNCKLRPLYTGWFADFDSLESDSKEINYSNNGYRFSGSTMDFSALYRFNATWNLLKREGITVKKIHQYVRELQDYWCEKFNSIIKAERVFPHMEKIGHFISYKFKNNDELLEIYNKFNSLGIYTDYRQEYLRIGLGLHHTTKYIDKAYELLNH
jgi:selenocysteine lyase/cysteine desulfurase